MEQKNREAMFLDAENLMRYLKNQIGAGTLSGNVDVDVPMLTEKFEQHKEIMQGEESAVMAENMLIIERWRKYKTIYAFDESLQRALRDSDAPEIHIDILRRLPYDAFFIDFGGTKTVENDEGPLIGAFVIVEPADDGTVVIGACEVGGHIPEKHNIMMYANMFRAKDGEEVRPANMSVMMPSLEEQAVDKNNMASAIERAALYRHELDVMELVVKCIYYLAAQNADIRQIKQAKDKRTKRYNGTRINLRRWEVGYRIGEAFRKRESELAQAEQGKDTEHEDSDSDQKDKRNRPRPHVRRAHWHHYWCGEGRTRLEVQWLSPMFVNASDKDDAVVATKHDVKTEKKEGKKK